LKQKHIKSFLSGFFSKSAMLRKQIVIILESDFPELECINSESYAHPQNVFFNGCKKYLVIRARYSSKS